MKNTHRGHASALAIGLAAMAVASTGARAQTATTSGAGEATPAAASDDLGDIIVTAQKRIENVQDIPKTVEVLTQSTLTAANVTNLNDLTRISPSIQGTATAGSPPAIRGISSFAYSIGVQAQTGIVLDDVPQPNFSTLADELSDVERVEVLPGPQSTLSGRNAAGGLINIVTRSPSQKFAAQLTTEVTQDHQQRVAGYITGPITESIAASVSGYYNNWDGPLDNKATGDRIGGYQRAGIRAKVKADMSDRLSATLTGYYTRNRAPTVAITGGYAYSTLGDQVQSYFVPAPLKRLLQGVTPGPYNADIYSVYQGRLRSHDVGGTLRLDYDSDIGTISSITSVTRSKSRDTTPLVAFTAFPDIEIAEGHTVNYKTQEFRLASVARGKLQYLLGAIYSDTKIFEPYARPVLYPVDWRRTAINRSFALYGRTTYEVLPATFVTGGLRYQHDFQKYGWIFADGSAPTSEGSNKYDFVSGEASLRHEFTDDLSAYVTYANAQTGRAYDLEDSVTASTGTLDPLASEKVHSLEGGFKTRWIDNRLTFNVALFDAKYRNYQIQQAFLPAGGGLPSIRLFSIGNVETRGIEFDGSFAVTPDFRLSAAVTILDAKIRGYPNALCYTGQTLPSCATTGTQGDLKGTRMPGASRFKAIGNAAYTLRLPSLPVDATLNAQFRYQTAFHTNVLNDPASHVPGYGLVNIATGVQDHDKRYRLELFVNNLFDKKNYAALERDTVTFDPTGASNPTAVTATYARDFLRYGGLRLTFDY